MPALFPGAVRIFTEKVDLVDTVMASHVNILQDEVTSIETTLGTGLLSSSWSGSYANPSTHTSLTSRLENIEAGVKSSAATLSGVTGQVVGTTQEQTLTNKTLTAPTITNATVSGSLVVTGTQTLESFRARNVYMANVAPTSGQGNNGDIWIQYRN